MIVGQRCRGFTLIELLVAIGIAVIIAVIGYGALGDAARKRNVVESRFERFAEVQLAMRLLANDLAQVRPRPVRDLIGNDLLPAVFTGDGGSGIELTTGGWSNPMRLPRSTLQRVGYEIEDDTLYRNRWPVLDRTQGTIPQRRELLTGVLQMQVRLMNAQREWQNSWPPLNAGESSTRALPIAVEVTLELDDFGIISRMIEVPR